ncbi:agmatine deiminase [Pseudaeromonas sp. ZJS20]|uniref:agmatine deiminase n=1 Tax=Pseudaeromonas aegiceratis TaxID=3153928 RepID=UPI00390C41DC
MSTLLSTLPAADGFFMPAEWAPQQAVWMIWPYRPDNWREAGRYAQATFAQLAEAIGAATPVFMGVPARFMEQAREIMPAAVTLVEMNSDDCWARDTGPTVVINAAGECRGVDWGFNAWGGHNGGLYFPWDQDELVARQMLATQGFDRYQAPLILEGGSIHVDGEGTCLTTAECLLNANRNPHLSQAQIEQHLQDYLGIRKVIWLQDGTYLDETDGHIDNMACFVRPGEVLLTWTDDEQDPQYPRSKAALEVLQNATDAQGRKLKIWLIPQPGPLYCSEEESQGVIDGSGVPRESGHRLAGSYVNFLITNDRIVYPLLDPKTDTLAQAKLEEIFPDHTVVGIPGREILLGGGNIHCITQQIPSGK